MDKFPLKIFLLLPLNLCSGVLVACSSLAHVVCPAPSQRLSDTPAASVQSRSLFVPVIVFLLNPFQTCSLEASRPCPRLTDTPRLPPMVNISHPLISDCDSKTYFHIIHVVFTVKASLKDMSCRYNVFLTEAFDCFSLLYITM